jgi:hypothetical protein
LDPNGLFTPFARLEVILKDASDPSKSLVVVKKELPYSFDVTSARIRKPTRHQMQQADINNIGPSPPLPPEIRRRDKNVSLATTLTARLEPGLQAEAIDLQAQQEQVAGGNPARGQAGQRIISHVFSVVGSGQQNPSEVQRWPLVIPVSHPHIPLVPDRHGSLRGGDKDRSEGDQDSVVTGRSGDTSSNSGNTTRYHWPAFSGGGKAVTAPESPNSTKLKEVHKEAVGTPNQRTEEPCNCTW